MLNGLRLPCLKFFRAYQDHYILTDFGRQALTMKKPLSSTMGITILNAKLPKGHTAAEILPPNPMTACSPSSSTNNIAMLHKLAFVEQVLGHV